MSPTIQFVMFHFYVVEGFRNLKCNVNRVTIHGKLFNLLPHGISSRFLHAEIDRRIEKFFEYVSQAKPSGV